MPNVVRAVNRIVAWTDATEARNTTRRISLPAAAEPSTCAPRTPKSLALATPSAPAKERRPVVVSR